MQQVIIIGGGPDGLLAAICLAHQGIASTVIEKHSSTRIGDRAPHCWLAKGDRQISSLDLYSNAYVLVCHPDAHYWQEAYRQSPCKIVTIGKQGDYQDINNDFLKTYGITKEGAVLVRPDGHVQMIHIENEGVACL